MKLRSQQRSLAAVAAAAVTLGLGLGACGGDSRSAGEAAEDLIETGCQKAHECRDSAPVFPPIYGDNPAACVANISMFVDFDAIDASVAAGRIRYSASDANTCINFIDGLSCEQFWNTGTDEPAACDTMLQGTVADGDACTIDDDCANAESFCDEETNQCTVFGV